uniref:Protein-tyrosine-phosphatase n=1 Tax=Rhabditophanes sp. KR3021 TaxID=114890 RepID=A0AC35U3X2_9BILA
MDQNCICGITGQEAESILQKFGEKGDFLVRPSSAGEKEYSLSIHRGNNRVTHVKILKNEDFYNLNEEEAFRTITELMNFHILNPGNLKEMNGEIITLTKLLIYHSTKYDQLYFHSKLSREDAEKLLIEIGKKGTFLVREKADSATNLVLSALYTEDSARHVVIQVKDNIFDISSGLKFPTLDALIEHHKIVPLVIEAGNVLKLENCLTSTKIFAYDIDKRIEKMYKNNKKSKTLFDDEFERLQASDSIRTMYTCQKEGKKAENVNKNKFKNNIPYDHTRVKLLNEGKEPRSDYINANWIDAQSKDIPEYADLKVRYISTQGCLENTIGDFWQMAWQAGCRVIAMITQLSEKTRYKCSCYWPESKSTPLTTGLYDDILVSFLSENHLENYIVRTFNIKKYAVAGSGADYNKVVGERIIHHFQYTDWLDFWCPKNPHSVVVYLRDVNSILNAYVQSERGPLLVHCSAGIGRTGAIIVIDLLINYILQNGYRCYIDILNTIKMVRTQRNGLVQTGEQYKFVYKAVEAFIKEKKKEEMSCKNSFEHLKFPITPTSANTISMMEGSSSASPQSYFHQFANFNPNSVNRLINLT